MNLDERLNRAAEETRAATQQLDVPEVRRAGLPRWVGPSLAFAGAAVIVLFAVLAFQPDAVDQVPVTEPETPPTTVAPELPDVIELMPLGPEPTFTLPGTILETEWKVPTPEEVAAVLANSTLEGTGYGIAGKAGVTTVLLGPAFDDGMCVAGSSGAGGTGFCHVDGIDSIDVSFDLDLPERTNNETSATVVIRGQAVGVAEPTTALAAIQVGDTTFVQRPRGRVVWLPATFSLSDTPQLRLYSARGDVQHSVPITTHHEYVDALVRELQAEAEAALAAGTADEALLADLMGRLSWLQQLVQQLPPGNDELPAILTDVGKTLADIQQSLRTPPTVAPVAACISIQQYESAYRQVFTAGTDQQAALGDMRTHATNVRAARPDLDSVLDVTLGWAIAYTEGRTELTQAEMDAIEASNAVLREEVEFCSDPTAFIHSGGAMAIDIADGVIWVTTRWLYRGEGSPTTPPAILAIDPTTGSIMRAYQVSAPMHTLAAGTEMVWFGRVGDGGEPTNVIGRIDLGTGEVLELELSDNTPDGVVDIVVIGRRAYAVIGNPEDPRVLIFDESLEQIGSIDLPNADPSAGVLAGNKLQVSDINGTVWSIDVATGAVSELVKLGAWTNGLYRDPLGNLTWALMNDEEGTFVRAFNDSGRIVATYAGQPGEMIVDIVTNGPDALVIYERGTVEYVDNTGQAQVIGSTERSVTAGADVFGVTVWLVTEIGFEQVSLGQ